MTDIWMTRTFPLARYRACVHMRMMQLHDRELELS